MRVTIQHFPPQASILASLQRKFAEIRWVLGTNFHSKETIMYFLNQKTLNGDTH